MPEQQATSDGGSETPTSSSPTTGTPASPGATPSKAPTLSLEEAQARIAELERHATNKAEEAARHGKNLSAAEKKLAAYEEKERLATEAALSEAQKLEKRAAEAERQTQQYKQQLITARVELAARAKDFINPSIAAKVVQDSLEFGDDGMPSNLDKALDELAKQNPFLLHVKAPDPVPPSAQTAPGAAQTPALPAMNPGRSSIQQPGTLSPGQTVRLDQAFTRPRTPG